MTGAPQKAPAWRDPRVMSSIVGGVVLEGLLIAFAFGKIDFEWGQSVGQPVWIRVLAGAGAVGFFATFLVAIYDNVQRELSDPPNVEPAVLVCAVCGESFPSRYYFDEMDPNICRKCAKQPNRPAERSK